MERCRQPRFRRKDLGGPRRPGANYPPRDRPPGCRADQHAPRLFLTTNPMMTDSPLVERERSLLHDLSRLAAERAKAESDTVSGHRSRRDAIEGELDEARRRIGTGLESDK